MIFIFTHAYNIFIITFLNRFFLYIYYNMNNDNIIIKFNNINHNKNDYKLFSIFSTFFEKKK